MASLTRPSLPLSNPAAGIVFYVLAVGCFSLMDLTAKTLALHVPVVEVLWARYMGQSLAVTALVLLRIRTVARTRYPGLQFLRSALLLAATSLFFLAVSRMGLAEATAIMDVNPVLITLGAALILGERFGPRRAFGVGAALVGALIIIRPGSAVFSPSALLPFAAAFAYAGFALATRFVGKGEPALTSLFYSALLGAVLLSVAVAPAWQRPEPVALALMAVIGLIGATGQLLMIRAFTFAEASVVAPFSYAGLLFATLWGALAFGDFPDGPTIAGAAIVVCAGLYVWHRETTA